MNRQRWYRMAQILLMSSRSGRTLQGGMPRKTLKRSVMRRADGQWLHRGSCLGLVLICWLLRVVVAAAAPPVDNGAPGALPTESSLGETSLVRAWTAVEVASLAKQLGEADGEQRVRAFDALRSAPAFAFEALRAHAEARLLGDDGPPSATLAAQEARFRHALGLFRADVFEDIAPGARIALRKDATLAPAAERLAMMRALEANTLHAEAPALMLRLLAAQAAAWAWEAHRVARRVDVRLAPALYRMTASKERDARMLARKLLSATGLDVPSAALLRASGENVPLHTLRELIGVLGAQRHISAMEDVRTYLTDPRPSVRRAAWVASGHFRKDFIWQLRKLYEVEFGENADMSLGHERLRVLLEQHVEARFRADTGQAMPRAQALARRGDLEAMDVTLEPLWSSDPRAIPAGFVTSYQRLATARTAEGNLRGASDASWRAAFLLGLSERDAADGTGASAGVVAKAEQAVSEALVLEGDAALASSAVPSAAPATGARSEAELGELRSGRFWQYYWQAARGMTPSASALQRLRKLSGEKPWFGTRKRRALAAALVLVMLAGVYRFYGRRRPEVAETAVDDVV